MASDCTLLTVLNKFWNKFDWLAHKIKPNLHVQTVGLHQDFVTWFRMGEKHVTKRPSKYHRELVSSLHALLEPGSVCWLIRFLRVTFPCSDQGGWNIKGMPRPWSSSMIFAKTYTWNTGPWFLNLRWVPVSHSTKKNSLTPPQKWRVGQFDSSCESNEEWCLPLSRDHLRWEKGYEDGQQRRLRAVGRVFEGRATAQCFL